MHDEDEKELRARRAAALAGGGVLALGLLWVGRHVAMKGADFQLAGALAERWTPFGVDARDVLAIIGVESDYRFGLENHSERAEARGGAWGAMQMTLATARDLATLLRAKAGAYGPSTEASVLATLPKFDPNDGRTLLDPMLNVMLGAFYLSRLSKEFGGNFSYMAAAYHNGGPFVRNLLASGKRVPDDMPPLGKEYVALALARREQLDSYNPEGTV